MLIIPCSKEKRWSDGTTERSVMGPLPAREVYTSPLHLAAQDYAQVTGRPWLILSALHGLLRPDDQVPADYDVTFSRPNDPVISAEALAQQAQRLGLDRADRLVSLCPADYNDRLRAALGQVPLDCPLDAIALHDLKAMTEQVLSLKA